MRNITDSDTELDRALLRGMAGALAVFLLLWACSALPYISVAVQP